MDDITGDELGGAAVTQFAPPWPARLDLAFTRDGGKTRLIRGTQYGPLTLKKALYPEDPSICHAVILHPPGGVVHGDELGLNLDVQARAQVLVTTPGATKWYRGERRAHATISAHVAAGAVLEYLPQENIVFDAARGVLETRIDLAEGATLMAMEITCLGRPAADERFARGEWRQSLHLTRHATPLFWERLRLQGGDPLLSAAAGLAGDATFGNLVIADAGLDRLHLDCARACRSEAARACVTLLPGVLVARATGATVEPVRNYLLSVWHALREAVTGAPPAWPRIWRT